MAKLIENRGLKMNQIKIGAILSYLSLIITIIISLVYTPILLKNLGQAEYGVYSLMAAFVGYLTILDMGLGNAIVRYVARTRANNDKEQESRLSGMFLILFSLLGTLVVVAGIIMYFQIDFLFGTKLDADELHLAETMAIILIANFALSFPLSVFGAIIQAHERFIFLKLTNIIRTIVTPTIIVPMLFLGHGSVMVVTITSMANILFLLFNVWYCFKKLEIKIRFEKFDDVILKEILIYSGFIFLNAIMDKIYWSTDQIILGAVSGANQVAIYAIAMQFVMIYMSIATAISGLYLPKVSIMVIKQASDKDFSDLFINVGKIQAIIIFYVIGGFLYLGKEFIQLWVGPSNLNTYYIVAFLFLPLSIIWTQALGIPILQAKNLHKFRSIVYLSISIINILVTIPIAKVYGELGTAIVTSICLALSHIFIMNIYYYKKIKIQIFDFFKKVTKTIFITFIVILITNSTMVFFETKISWLSLIIGGLIYTGMYILIIYIFDLPKEIKEKIRGILIG